MGISFAFCALFLHFFYPLLCKGKIMPLKNILIALIKKALIAIIIKMVLAIT
jgi:hypothetical protein